MQRIVNRLVLVILGVLLAGVLVEGLLRLLPIPNRFTMIRLFEEMWENDEELLLKLKPNLDLDIYGHPEFRFTVQTNEVGVRDKPTPPVEVAAIGDSFTFGFGVEADQSWPEQLEQFSGVEVVNLGWVGWSSFVYPVAIERHAIPLGARIWIWGFFVNDLPESAGAEAFQNSGSEDYLSWNQAGRFRAEALPFPWNLRTLQFIAALSDPELFLLPGSGDQLYEGPEFTMRFGSYAWEATDPSRPDVQRGWELTEAALKRAKALADEYGARLLLVHIPAREYVYWPYLAPQATNLDVGQLEEVEMRLAEICAQQQIDFLSLLPGFRAQALAGEMLYYPQDGHWNVQGHTLAAQLIRDYLIEYGLLSGDES